MMALPFQIAPLPSAEGRRTIIEQALDSIDVVGRPLALGQRHAVEVEEPLGSLPLLVRGMASRVGRPELMLQSQVVAIADGQAEDRQHGHGPHQPQGRFRGPSMRPAEHALPEADRAGSDRLAFEEVAQIVGQLAGRGIAMPRLLGHRLQTDALQVARNGPVESPGTRRIGADDLVEQLGSSSRERKRAGEKLVENDAQAVDVRAMVDRMCRVAADGLLRAHVGGSADDRPVVGQMNRLLVKERQAEIDDPGLTGPARARVVVAAPDAATAVSSMMLAGLMSR